MTDNKVSLATLRDAYLRDVRGKRRPSYIDRVDGCLSKIITSTGAANVADLSIVSITCFEEQSDSGKVSAVGRSTWKCGALKTMLRWGSSARLIGSNPIEGVRPKNHTPREGRAFTQMRSSGYLTASPQPWRDIWYAYLVTGMRKMELASLNGATSTRGPRNHRPSGRSQTRTARRIPD